MAAEPVRLLFVGISFPYTRLPSLQHNIEIVTDLFAPSAINLPIGSDPALLPSWGGVPGIFKALTNQVGLELLAAIGPELDSFFAARARRKCRATCAEGDTK